MKLSPRLAATLALLAIGTAAAVAQYGPGPAGRAPYSVQPPARNEAGVFDYYSLVMSWSPTYCAGQTYGNPNDTQCNARDGRKYAFVMHGLWPQYEKGWPEECATRERPYVSDRTINHVFDVMPSKPLIIHEYKKHGTCSGLSPDAYFDLSRKLFTSIKVPARLQRPNQPLTIATDEIVRDFVEANPGLQRNMIAVVCGGPGNRLREVRICVSKAGEFRACGRNEDARRLCQSARVFVPPVRETAGGPPLPRRGSGPQNGVPEQGPLPGPADIGRGERKI